MQRSNRELLLALIAVLIITGLYLFMLLFLNGVPRASGFFGHSIGVFGFVLMLMTETLYSIRKRSRSARWGRISEWLRFHIFTGIVGPYLVLLHTSWKFNGLAGVVMLLTVVVVISGFIGRYIYTAVPRTLDGVVVDADHLKREIRAAESELQRWMTSQPELAAQFNQYLSLAPENPSSEFALILVRPVLDLQQRWKLRRLRSRLDGPLRGQLAEQFAQLESLVRQRTLLRRQSASLVMARRLLAVWHAVHIPLGMALFTAAFIHIIAAIYYATLLR
jgi:hypothetical protein